MSSWQAREYRSVRFVFAHERPGRPLSHTMEMLLLSADGKTNHGTRISSDVPYAIVAYTHAFDKFDNRDCSKLLEYSASCTDYLLPLLCSTKRCKRPQMWGIKKDREYAGCFFAEYRGLAVLGDSRIITIVQPAEKEVQ